jgi:hypothetical protein
LKPHFLIHPKFVFFGIVGFFFSHFLGKIFDRQCHLHLHLGVALEILHLICNAFFNVSLPLFLHKLYLRYFYFYLFFYFFVSVYFICLDQCWMLKVTMFSFFLFVLSCQFMELCVCLFYIILFYFIFHLQKGNFKSKILYTLLSPVTNIKKNPFFKFIE